MLYIFWEAVIFLCISLIFCSNLHSRTNLVSFIIEVFLRSRLNIPHIQWEVSIFDGGNSTDYLCYTSSENCSPWDFLVIFSSGSCSTISHVLSPYKWVDWYSIKRLKKTLIAVWWVLSTCKFIFLYTLLWNFLAILISYTSWSVSPAEQDSWTLLRESLFWNNI